MRTGSQSSGRPAWYDRNPINTGMFGSTVQPGGTTNLVVDTYTPPANRMAFVSVSLLVAARLTAAAPSGQALIEVATQFKPPATTSFDMVTFNDNSIQLFRYQTTPMQLILKPSEAVKVIVADGSTGGTIFYQWGIAIMEFDQ